MDMACLKLGSKSEAFQREGHSWKCISALPSDIIIEIGEMLFHLHKFPLISRSGLLEKLIGELKSEDGSACVLQLGDIPGGAKAFKFIAKFCYGVRIELTALNVVSVRCAAEYLQMSEDYGEPNLIAQTEYFLNEVFNNWSDTIKALETCEEEVLPYAEQLHIVSRCINSLAVKACADSKLFNWPVSGCNNTEGVENVMWNGICEAGKLQPVGDDWWYEDVSFLSLPLYKRFLKAVEAAGMKLDNIAGSLVYYAKKYVPLMNRQSSFKDANHVKPGSPTSPSEKDQRALLQEIVELLPYHKGVIQTKFLIRLLRSAMILQASPSCREKLEKMVGMQLDQAVVDDLLIPNMGYSADTMYDIDCFQRILDHFLLMDQVSGTATPCITEETQLLEGANSLTSMTMVANLVDSYLADVATDVNLKLPKFQALAAAIPDYARPIFDGLYRAIDIYLKAHPWQTDPEREQICRLMNCQKLSLDANTHAAQNERLPLRVIVQVLFFEQLRLRTSISGWFYVSDNLDSSQNPNVSVLKAKNETSEAEQDRGSGIEDMRERVAEIEKECRNMKQEFQKLVKSKRFWNIFGRRKSNMFNNTASSQPSYTQRPSSSSNNHHQIHENGNLHD